MFVVFVSEQLLELPVLFDGLPQYCGGRVVLRMACGNSKSSDIGHMAPLIRDPQPPNTVLDRTEGGAI